MGADVVIVVDLGEGAKAAPVSNVFENVVKFLLDGQAKQRSGLKQTDVSSQARRWDGSTSAGRRKFSLSASGRGAGAAGRSR